MNDDCMGPAMVAMSMFVLVTLMKPSMHTWTIPHLMLSIDVKLTDYEISYQRSYHNLRYSESQISYK